MDLCLLFGTDEVRLGNADHESFSWKATMFAISRKVLPETVSRCILKLSAQKTVSIVSSFVGLISNVLHLCILLELLLLLLPLWCKLDYNRWNAQDEIKLQQVLYGQSGNEGQVPIEKSFSVISFPLVTPNNLVLS